MGGHSITLTLFNPTLEFQVGSKQHQHQHQDHHIHISLQRTNHKFNIIFFISLIKR
jgi:hypothetical protein